MRTPLFTALFLQLAVVCSGADHSLSNARRAQALLGSDVWSQVIRIENSSRSSRYPQSLHALVFELVGILWFYTDHDGTQSFSLHRGRLAEEKADFAPLLRDIDPGFRRWTVVEGDAEATGTLVSESTLTNGCFIESYATLRMLVARGAAVREPKLLSYYGKGSGYRQGHTVLTYKEASGLTVVDPYRPTRPRFFSADLATNPTQLARELQGTEVGQVRMLPLPLPSDSNRRDVFAMNQGAAVESAF